MIVTEAIERLLTIYAAKVRDTAEEIDVMHRLVLDARSAGWPEEAIAKAVDLTAEREAAEDD